ncbi:dTMP kinase [Paracoccus litorisediminis]|uniref:dTMP kinase n=1 Tax=Paracoccus litorisediminis TaxID=2006130 RepID=UPI0037325118
MFISIEAIDGAGKSTQCRRLVETLAAAGHDVVLTREPGGSPGAEDIRGLLVSGNPERWSPETEILLFTAARRDHVERLIRPALERGQTVITDRFADSTRIYQAAKNIEMRRMVDDLHALTIGVEPDLTIILDLDAEIAWNRSKARNASSAGPDEDRFEKRGLAFQEILRQGFLSLAKEAPQRFAVIDASGTPDEVYDRLEAAVMARLAPASLPSCG